MGNVLLKMMYMMGVHPRERNQVARDSQGGDLAVTIWGQKLQNPLGTSAGIDKGGEVCDALFELGPAIVELGGVTPLPQEGNPKPRCFRLPGQKAFINRYGLNSEGADSVAKRLRERVRIWAYHHGYGFGPEAEELVLNGEAGVNPGSLREGKMLMVQIAKNKTTPDHDIAAVTKDYVTCVEKLAPYSDILVVNVSSPNMPGLRDLQKVEPLTQILKGVVEAAHAVKRKTIPKVMVKVSPDEDAEEQIEGVVEAVWRSGVDGVIVGNTTKHRDGLIPNYVRLTSKEEKIMKEAGGFSGPQMYQRTLDLVKRYRQLLDQGPPSGKVPGENMEEKVDFIKKHLGNGAHEQKVIFATGGIWDGKQALEILNAGANVAQVYTAMVYGGSGTFCRIKKEMKEEMLAKKE